MIKRYHCLKTKIDQTKIDYLNIYFDNHELIVIHQKELIDFHFSFYDRLIKRAKGIHPVAKEGMVKFKIDNDLEIDTTGIFDQEQLKKNRKSYIINRMLEGGIEAIEFYDETGCSQKVYGDFLFNQEGDDLLLVAKEKPFFESFTSNYHYIDLPLLEKEYIQSISLDFMDGN